MKALNKFIYFIILTCYFQIANVYGQQWQDYNKLREKFLNDQKFDSSLVYAEKALEAVKSKIGTHDTLYADMLKYFCEIHFYNSNFQSALKYALQELSIRKDLQGGKHPSYIQCLGDVGALYGTQGNYEKAIPMMQESMMLRKEIYGSKSASYAESLNNLAYTLQDLGKYNDAEKLFLEANAIRKEVLGTEDPLYIGDLKNLGELYIQIGKYKEAEKILKEAISISRTVYGEYNEEYCTAISTIAILYQFINNYPKAEQWLLEALRISEKLYGKNSLKYGFPLHSLALLNQEIGNYEKAEELLKECILVIQNNRDTLSLTFELASLAAVYHNLHKFDLAENLYLEVIAMQKKYFGKNKLPGSYSLHNLGMLYKDKKDYKNAEYYLKLALSIRKQYDVETNPEYFATLLSLGDLYGNMREIHKADSIYQIGSEIKRKIGDNTSYNYILLNLNRAHNYFVKSDFINAEKYYFKAIETTNRSIIINTSFLSENEQEMLINKMNAIYSHYYIFSFSERNKNPNTGEVYNIILKNKGLLLKSASLMRETILNSSDTSLIKMMNDWLELKKEISKLQTAVVSKRIKNLDSLESQATKIEKQLMKNSRDFNDFENAMTLDWKKLQQSLKNDEATVEFVRYYRNIDSTYYFALIIKPDITQPLLVKLFEENEIENILQKSTDKGLEFVNYVYGTNQQPNAAFYNLIWQPLEKELNGIKTVYFSPDGILHKVSFSALVDNQNNFLSDTYNLIQVSSTGIIANNKNFQYNNQLKIGLVGGVNFNTSTTKFSFWDYLSGTRIETDKIKTTFKNNNVTYLYGDSATEQNFIKIAPQSNILHIATHGFFFPNPKILKQDSTGNYEYITEIFGGLTRGFGIWSFVRNEKPLMRSGLALAGANDVWIKKTSDQEEDGVLTAMEVSQLNLQNTQLVVLSACETGLGDIKGSEGVYGLQRAFKMAGVKYIIMSLWQVPDKETVEFMTTFYTKLLKQKDIRKAFTETQNEMRKKYETYYWAAFVLVE